MKSEGPYLGAHMSVAGGVSKAIDRAASVEARALQIFTKNSNQWKAKPLETSEIEAFQKGRETASLPFAFSHDSYLINLASPSKPLREKSIGAFLDEIDRADLLGLDFVVFHPGAHMEKGVDAGVARVADALNRMIDKRPASRTLLLIENAAGQGTTLGRSFEELAAIRDKVENKDRVGFCFDTCHAFAAGYDLTTKDGYAKSMAEFDRVAGIRNLRAFHINDSKRGLGCLVDRHMHIGKGEMGLEPFRSLLNDERFREVPMVLETPKSDDLHEDIENLSVLRSLIQRR